MESKLILIANPGSASRKYALYNDTACLAKLHFEMLNDQVVYSYQQGDQAGQQVPANISHLAFASSKLMPILTELKIIDVPERIQTIALRVVAPSREWQTDRRLSGAMLERLKALEPRAPLHISATLQEAELLQKYFPKAELFGMSDSAFHATMPAHASHYGIAQDIADSLDIRRFGYHGLSVESSVTALKATNVLPDRLIVCHLGSGVSITAVRQGQSVDTTMGYSPLEGVIMATRSGSIDVTAAHVIEASQSLSHEQLVELLNHRSGLLGVSKLSSDIRVLLQKEAEDPNAQLALKMYVYRIAQAVAEMAAALGGVDTLVFTGTVGERNPEMRRRIIAQLSFLGLFLDPKSNHLLVQSNEPMLISPAAHPARILVIPADEDGVIIQHLKRGLSS